MAGANDLDTFRNSAKGVRNGVLSHQQGRNRVLKRALVFGRWWRRRCRRRLVRLLSSFLLFEQVLSSQES